MLRYRWRVGRSNLDGSTFPLQNWLLETSTINALGFMYGHLVVRDVRSW